MKLIECHIAGFGAFEDYTLSFNDGLNVILQPNGWGKTTLSAYIKAMLYGFERKRVRDVSENERLRYKPWSGCKYGGTLDFEFGSNEYRVARTFGDTASGDTLVVVNIGTGKKVDLEGSEVGQWVFGLDAVAFQKTVFVANNGFLLDGSVSSLRGKLNMLVSESSDITMLDKANAELEKRRKHYKKAGSRGYIAEASTQITNAVERKRSLDVRIGQLDEIHSEILDIDSQLAQVSDAAAKNQGLVDAAIAGDKKNAALKAAHDQLVDRQKKAQTEYDSFCAKGIDALEVSDQDALKIDEAQLQKVRDAYGESMRARGEILEAKNRLASITQQKKAIVDKRGSLPTKDEVATHQSYLAELSHKQDVVRLATPAAPDGFDTVAAAVSSDDGLLARVDAVVVDWPSASKSISRLDDARRHDEKAKEGGTKQVAEATELCRSADKARKEADGAQESIRRCDAALEVLEKADKTRQAVVAEMSGLQSQIDLIREASGMPDGEVLVGGERALGAEGDMPSVAEACGRLEAEAGKCRDCDDDLTKARKGASREERALSELNTEKLAAERKAASAVGASVAADQELENARVAYREAENASKASEANRQQADAASGVNSKAAGKSKSSGYILAALGAVLIVVGIICAAVMGSGGMLAGAGIAIAGVALLVGGALSLSKAGKPNAVSSPVENQSLEQKGVVSDEIKSSLQAAEETAHKASAEKESAQAKLQEIVSRYEKQCDKVAAANEALRKAMDAADSLKIALAEMAEGLFPGESFDPDVIAVQVPTLVDRLKALDRNRENLAKVQKELDQKKIELERFDSELKDKLAEFSLCDIESISSVRNQLFAIKAADSRKGDKAEEAFGRLVEFVAKTTGKKSEELAGLDGEALLSLVTQVVDERCEEASAAYTRCQEEVSGFLGRVNDLSQAFGIESNSNIAVVVERLGSAAGDYRRYVKSLEDSKKKNEQTCREIDSLAENLDAWARRFGLAGRDGLTNEWFDALVGDVDAYGKMSWDSDELAKTISAATEQIAAVSPCIETFMGAYGVTEIERVPATIDSLTRYTKGLKGFHNELSSATEALASWEASHASELGSLANAIDENKLAALKESLSALRARQEELVGQRAQALERQDNLFRELECYYDCVQDLKLLADSKQNATAKLFTVQKTAALLEQARVNLDKRYLGGLTDRFNDYVSGLLEDEGLSVGVDGDFRVSVREGAASHDSAGYSTGYQDMLDICLRMALIDVVFEEEAPFVVMDDPFVNLDQDKIMRAIALLAVLSSARQIIYFTCHPSRIREGAGDEQAVFTLPERRASLELPAARAKREAEERARAQRELVASYRVAPVTHGRALIKVKGNGVISNNMFTLEFGVDDSGGSRDNAFEVHFIDECGRALCERKGVEIVDGCVVPERLRFCLSTREDSGSEYDLIVHEVDRDESELAARVPFTSKVSFEADDFGF